MTKDVNDILTSGRRWDMLNINKKAICILGLEWMNSNPRMQIAIII